MLRFLLLILLFSPEIRRLNRPAQLMNLSQRVAFVDVSGLYPIPGVGPFR